MNVIQRFELWGDRHHPKWLDIIRIALGLFLFYKGIDVLRNMSSVISLMAGTKLHFSHFFLSAVAQFIFVAHLMGGILLTLGIHTRLVCLVQIPILIGAIILINYSDSSSPFSELILPVIVLLLLIYFMIVGNGPWSFEKMSEEEKRK